MGRKREEQNRYVVCGAENTLHADSAWEPFAGERKYPGRYGSFEEGFAENGSVSKKKWLNISQFFSVWKETLKLKKVL